MESRTLPARQFLHSRIGMDRMDRYHDKTRNAFFIPVSRDDVGYLLRSENDEEYKIFLSHEEIYVALDSNKASIRYGYNSPAQQKIRAIFGDKPWDEFKVEDRDLALHREKLIHLYDAECEHLGKRLPMSEEKLGSKLLAWNREINDALLDIAADGRADQRSQVVIFPCPSVKTFKRDYDDYHNCDDDVMALLPRHHGPGPKLFALKPEAIAFAHKMAMAYLDRRRPTKAHVYRSYLAELQKHNADLPIPKKIGKVSRKKFEAMIARLDKYHVIASRHGEKYAIQKFKAIRRSFHVVAPGQRIEMDFVTVDLISLLVETGIWNALPETVQVRIPLVRICFCAAIDVATRYILALKASTNPNAASAVATIRMIMSDKRHLSSYVAAQTPWIGKIRPRVIYTDNGSEFTAQRTAEVLRAARIHGTRPPAGDPGCRPFIESLFHSIGLLIAPYFEGRTFSSVVEKGDYDPQVHAALLVDELIKIFIFAVCDIYHNKPHSGLGGNTPHNAWVEASKEYEILYPPDAEEMLQIFGIKTTRRISDYGITVFGITYCDAEIQRLRTMFDQVDVEIKYDPECPVHIAVKGDKGWFVVRNTVGLDDSVTLAEWMAARKELRASYTTAAEQGMTVMYDAINRLRAIGDAATLRAGLSPSVPTAKDFDRWDAELFGAWMAAPSEDRVQLLAEGPLPDDPLRIGMVIQRPELFALEKSEAEEIKENEIAATQAPDALVSGFHYDEEY
ncbi:integrase [Rhizobium sp. GHKF11]|nr:integrase [Rhizobium sp. GHKF11]